MIGHGHQIGHIRNGESRVAEEWAVNVLVNVVLECVIEILKNVEAICGIGERIHGGRGFVLASQVAEGEAI
jgi:hypothetical protein